MAKLLKAVAIVAFLLLLLLKWVRKTRRISKTAPLKALRIEVDGEGPTLFFVHGFPCDHRMWDRQVQFLRGRYRCVRCILPDFDQDEPTKAWGYSVREVVRLLGDTVAEEAHRGPVTLVTHDWGAWLGYLLHSTRPDLVQRVVCVDVGDPDWSAPHFRLISTAYQGYLILAWMLGPPLGTLLNYGFDAYLSPARPSGANVNTCMNYLYWHKWADITWFKETLRDYHPECPVLYLYSKHKLRVARYWFPALSSLNDMLQVHSKSWLERVRRSHKTSKVVEFEERSILPWYGASHWPMLDDPDQFNHILEDFLSSTEPAQ